MPKPPAKAVVAKAPAPAGAQEPEAGGAAAVKDARAAAQELANSNTHLTEWKAFKRMVNNPKRWPAGFEIPKEEAA
eukprot:1850401-Alexandrium_andersonii.AAC.1